MKRRTLVGGIAAAAAAAAVPGTASPRRIGMSDVNRLNKRFAEIIANDHRHGGQPRIEEQATALADEALNLQNAGSATQRVRNSLYASGAAFHPTEYGDSEKKSLFSRGYKAMQQLDHPRVIKVKGYTEAPIGFFMEYVDGPNFRDLPNIIEDPVEVLQFLLLTAETIAHAHSRPVIHRDIKPENILALYRPGDNTWIPHLTDFDLA